MAVPLTFTPKPVDHKHELQKRLAAAPNEHAEALLVLWDLLQTAHDQGILDLLDGMVSAKDKIAETVAKYAKTPEGIASIRNLLAAAKVLGAIDPELLDHLSKVIVSATADFKREQQPPSLFALAKRAASEDSRRGLSFVTLILSALGKSLK
jgi:uncharacterized protein YjgD (DUF1641 family)